jgi:hypothetical protein
MTYNYKQLLQHLIAIKFNPRYDEIKNPIKKNGISFFLPINLSNMPIPKAGINPPTTSNALIKLSGRFEIRFMKKSPPKYTSRNAGTPLIKNTVNCGKR